MSNESINNCVRHIVNQANELTKKQANGRSEVDSKCAADKMNESNKPAEPKPVESVKPVESAKPAESNKCTESKSGESAKSDHKANKSDQHESIKIIQTKPAPRTAPRFDVNNNLPPQNDLKATENGAPKSTDETDKASVKAKQLNGDDLPAEKAKQQELPEIELIIRVSFSFPDKHLFASSGVCAWCLSASSLCDVVP